MKEIINRLKTLVKTATELNTVATDSIPSDAFLHSNLGGICPYAESGEQWPLSKSGKPLSFIFQLERKEIYHWPKNIAMIQFFYSFEEDAWSNEDDGWFVKTYQSVKADQYEPLIVPALLEEIKYSEIKNSSYMSLPNVEGIIMTDPKVFHLCGSNGMDRIWSTYNNACEKVLGDTSACSQVGGYPQWIQDDATPLNDAGEPLVFILQIKSDADAGLMFSDNGIIYLFYDREKKNFNFCLQAH